MGTDIHIVAQVFIDDKWRTMKIDPGSTHRNYHYFSQLADVRNSLGVPFISEAKGIPQDLIDSGEIDPDNEDYEIKTFSYEKYGEKCNTYSLGEHSFSWLLLMEIEEFLLDKVDEKDIENDYQLCHLYVILKRLTRAHEVDTDCVRIVFGFDS